MAFHARTALATRYSFILVSFMLAFSLLPAGSLLFPLLQQIRDRDRHLSALETHDRLRDVTIRIGRETDWLAGRLEVLATCAQYARSVEECAPRHLLESAPWIRSIGLWSSRAGQQAEWTKGQPSADRFAHALSAAMADGEFARVHVEEVPAAEGRDLAVVFVARVPSDQHLFLLAEASWRLLVREASRGVSGHELVVFDLAGNPLEGKKGGKVEVAAALVGSGPTRFPVAFPIGLERVREPGAERPWTGLTDVLGLLLISLLGVSFLAWGASRFLLRPIQKLESLVRRYRHGDYEAPAPGFRLREFAGIERTLAEMGGMIRRQIAEMRGNVVSLHKMSRFSERLIRCHTLVDLALELENSLRSVTGKTVLCLYLRDGKSIRRFRYAHFGEEYPELIEEFGDDRTALDAGGGQFVHQFSDPDSRQCNGILVMPKPLEEESVVFLLLVESLASIASITLSNIEKMQTAIQKSRLEAEIEAARIVQDALLPASEELDLLGVRRFYRAADVAGGDWFGVYRMKRHNTLAFFIGDVTGHGISSSIVTGVVCGAVSALQACFDDPEVSLEMRHEQIALTVARTLNTVLHSTGARCDRFMTMLMAFLDLDSGIVHFLSAGHTPAILVRGEGGKSAVLPALGSLLGFGEETHFDVRAVQLEPGDSLFMYTDGLTENPDTSGERLGLRGLSKMLKRQAGGTEGVDSLFHRAEDEWKERAPEDDVAMLLFTWPGAAVSKAS